MGLNEANKNRSPELEYCRVYSVGNKKYGIGFKHKAVSHPSCPKGYKQYYWCDMTWSFDTEEELNDFIAKTPDLHHLIREQTNE